jgi:hypothetical protein
MSLWTRPDVELVSRVMNAELPQFTDIPQLFDTAESLEIPVDYIARYGHDTDVCELFPGMTNPDLTGIGVRTISVSHFRGPPVHI